MVEVKAIHEIIEEKRRADLEKVIRVFEGEEELSILKGRYGPYISYQSKNYRIPKTADPEKLTQEECMEIIAKSAKSK